MPRRFGPTLGAGVVVIETDADKAIQPAPTGITCYVGVTEKGDTNKLLHCPTKADFIRLCGGYIDGTDILPDSAFDFYNLGNGAGELFVLRITDGTEVQSSVKVYGRNKHIGYYGGKINSTGYIEDRQMMFQVNAKNGGEWGGRRKTLGFSFDESTATTATTIATGITMLKNEYAGAKLRVENSPAQIYEVISNTTAGVLTLKAGTTLKADTGNPSISATKYGYVYLDTKEYTYPLSRSGTKKGLSVEFMDGQLSEDSYFGMRVYEDENLVLEYPNLSMDPSNVYYIANVVNDDEGNPYVNITNIYGASLDIDTRPASQYGVAQDWSSNVLTVQYWSLSAVATTNDHAAWVDSFTEASGAAILPQRLKLTYVASGTKFAITGVDGYGHVIGSKEVTASTLSTGKKKFEYTADDIFTPSFIIWEGAAGLSDGDILYLDIQPFPVDADGNGLLAGQSLYYDVGTDKRAKLRIEDNTFKSITLASAPPSAPTEGGQPTAKFTGTAISFPLTSQPSFIVVEHSSFGYYKFDAGTEASIGALVSAINTDWQTFTGGTGDLVEQVGSSDAIALKFDTSSGEKGHSAFLRLVSSHSDANLPAAGIKLGTNGAEYRLQGRIPLIDGYNGDAPSKANFTDGADSTSSLINGLFGENKGLVKIALPGISANTDSTDIQKAYIAYADARNYQYRLEIPSNIVTETAAVAYVNDTIGRNDFAVVSFPSWGYVSNPAGEGLVLRSLTGSIHGREALIAKNFSGYHKAAAGVGVILPNVSKLPWETKVLNEEILTPQGINVVKKAKGNFILWGDRTISLDSAWKFKHQREQMSHYENILREEFDFVIFAINDAKTRRALLVSLQTFFIPEWQKRALRGDKFSDAASFKIDGENNTNLSMANGDLNAEIKLRLADTVERFIIRIGKAGIFEDIG